MSLTVGVPNPGAEDRYRIRATQQEVSGRRVSEASYAAAHRVHYCLNHHPPQPPSMEKLSSTKLVPGAGKVGDHCLTVYIVVFFKLMYLYFIFGCIGSSLLGVGFL